MYPTAHAERLNSSSPERFQQEWIRQQRQHAAGVARRVEEVWVRCGGHRQRPKPALQHRRHCRQCEERKPQPHGQRGQERRDRAVFRPAPRRPSSEGEATRAEIITANGPAPDDGGRASGR